MNARSNVEGYTYVPKVPAWNARTLSMSRGSQMNPAKGSFQRLGGRMRKSVIRLLGPH